MRHTAPPREVYRLERWMQVRSAIVPILSILGLLAGGWGWFLYQERASIQDMAGAPLQTASGVLLRRDLTNGTKSSAYVVYLLSFRLHNRIVDYRTTDLDKAVRTPIGVPVTIAYRTGKSGNVTIYNWDAPPQRTRIRTP